MNLPDRVRCCLRSIPLLDVRYLDVWLLAETMITC